MKPVPESSLPTPDFGVVTAFQKETADLVRRIRAAAADLRRVEDLFPYLEATMAETPAAKGALFARFAELRATAADLRLRLLGDPIRNRWDEPSTPSISRRAGQVAGGHWDTRQAPTATHRRNLEIAAQQFAVLETELAELVDSVLPAFERDLDQPARRRGLENPESQPPDPGRSEHERHRRRRPEPRLDQPRTHRERPRGLPRLLHQHSRFRGEETTP